MREIKDAPVDLMGASTLADKTLSAEVQNYQYLIGLMLSSQTKDQTVYEAMKKLKKTGLTVEKIDSMSED